MKKLINVFFIATAITLVIIGCKGKNSVANDPRTVLSSFFERISKKDIEGASKLATRDSKSTMDMMKMGMDMAEKMKDKMSKEQKDPAEEFKNVEIGEAKINGNDATVAFKNKKNDTSFDFPLKKEDGSWKVDFSMSSLMKMGMEQAGKTGGTENMTSDSLTKALKQMQDSIMKVINDPEKMEKMKEALKELDKLKTN